MTKPREETDETRLARLLRGDLLSGGASVTKPRDETHLACLVRGDTGAYYRVGPRVDDDLHLGRTPLEGLGGREAVDVHAIVGDFDRVVVAHLMRNMISGNHQQSVAISGNHKQSVAIHGNPWHLDHRRAAE